MSTHCAYSADAKKMNTKASVCPSRPPKSGGTWARTAGCVCPSRTPKWTPEMGERKFNEILSAQGITCIKGQGNLEIRYSNGLGERENIRNLSAQVDHRNRGGAWARTAGCVCPSRTPKWTPQMGGQTGLKWAQALSAGLLCCCDEALQRTPLQNVAVAVRLTAVNPALGCQLQFQDQDLASVDNCWVRHR